MTLFRTPCCLQLLFAIRYLLRLCSAGCQLLWCLRQGLKVRFCKQESKESSAVIQANPEADQQQGHRAALQVAVMTVHLKG